MIHGKCFVIPQPKDPRQKVQLLNILIPFHVPMYHGTHPL